MAKEWLRGDKDACVVGNRHPRHQAMPGAPQRQLARPPSLPAEPHPSLPLLCYCLKSNEILLLVMI